MSNPLQLPEINKTTLMLNVEYMYRRRDIRLVLIDLYNELGTQTAVAARLGLSQPTIVNWFKLLGIVLRSRSEAVLAPPPNIAPREAGPAGSQLPSD